jgi:hypothetical protein
MKSKMGLKYRRGCDGKRKFIHPLKAEEFIRQSKLELRVYGCKWCGGWHLTSQALSGREEGGE